MSKYEMKDIIVLLPGITGSVLKKNGNIVWGYSAGSIVKALFTLGGNIRNALALPYDDPEVDDLGDGVVADSLMPDIHMLPGIWKIDGYSAISDAIKANFNVKEGKNFFAFPYDWRRDNRVAARKLQNMSHNWLSSWRESSGNNDAKLILLGHSMGGIVSRYFLECMEGWKVTKALVTFGTPYRGSLNSLDGLSNGMKKAKGLIDMSEMIRQFTSMYQLLPVYECYDPGDGTFVRVGETTGIPNLDSNMSAAALKFHHEIENYVTSNRKNQQFQDHRYNIYPIVGIAQETNLSAKLVNGEVIMLETFKGKELGGDGTVPRVSAIPIELSDDTSSAMYAGTRHGSLQNAESVIQHFTGVLSGFDLNLGNFKKNISRVSLKVDDIYFPGEQIILQARPTNGDVTLNVDFFKIGENRKESKQIVTKDNDWHKIEFTPPDPGSYRVTISGPKVETVQDTFVVSNITY